MHSQSTVGNVFQKMGEMTQHLSVHPARVVSRDFARLRSTREDVRDRLFGHVAPVAPVAPVICVRNRHVAPMRYLSCESSENVRKRSVARRNRFLGFRRQIGDGGDVATTAGGDDAAVVVASCTGKRSSVNRAHAPPSPLPPSLPSLPPHHRHYHHRRRHVYALITSSELVGINWSHQLTRSLSLEPLPLDGS